MAGRPQGARDGSDPSDLRPDRFWEGDSFRAFLRGLPDDIANVKEDSGEPFVVEFPAEPEEHAKRLLAALGAEWTVVPVTETRAADVCRSYDCHTPHCTGTARSSVGRYSYCDECRERRDAEQRRTGRPASLAERLPPSIPPVARLERPTLPAVPNGASLAGKVKQLGRLGKEVDRAFAAAKIKAEIALDAKRKAEDLQRQFRALGRELFGGES